VQVWNRDLSAHDPDGPLPEQDPDPDADSIIKGRARRYDDRLTTARAWRAIAEERELSIRELSIEVTGRQSFVGTPAQVAGQIDRFVLTDAADGFILVPHLVPSGLDEFVDTVVPLLQERGVFRTAYTASTLRGNLGLGAARTPDGEPV
jgi:alkanesulfonate monooxygenase SsuD/methylene tetrahydromethanopterin reductase-like flavin-dependent oxidoreductase (luciferase family)